MSKIEITFKDLDTNQELKVTFRREDDKIDVNVSNKENIVQELLDTDSDILNYLYVLSNGLGEADSIN